MDEQDLTAQFKVTRNEGAVPALESFDLEPKDFVSSDAHARLYAYYPDKKKLSSSHTI